VGRRDRHRRIGRMVAGNGLLAASALVPQPRRLRVVSRDHIHIEGLPELLELSPADLPWRAITVAVAAVLSLFVASRRRATGRSF